MIRRSRRQKRPDGPRCVAREVALPRGRPRELSPDRLHGAHAVCRVLPPVQIVVDSLNRMDQAATWASPPALSITSFEPVVHLAPERNTLRIARPPRRSALAHSRAGRRRGAAFPRVDASRPRPDARVPHPGGGGDHVTPPLGCGVVAAGGRETASTTSESREYAAHASIVVRIFSLTLLDTSAPGGPLGAPRLLRLVFAVALAGGVVGLVLREHPSSRRAAGGIHPAAGDGPTSDLRRRCPRRGDRPRPSGAHELGCSSGSRRRRWSAPSPAATCPDSCPTPRSRSDRRAAHVLRHRPAAREKKGPPRSAHLPARTSTSAPRSSPASPRPARRSSASSSAPCECRRCCATSGRSRRAPCYEPRGRSLRGHRQRDRAHPGHMEFDLLAMRSAASVPAPCSARG